MEAEETAVEVFGRNDRDFAPVRRVSIDLMSNIMLNLLQKSESLHFSPTPMVGAFVDMSSLRGRPFARFERW